MRKQEDYVKTALRVPPDVHQAVHAAAKTAERTFNAEIIHRLRSSFQPARQQPEAAK